MNIIALLAWYDEPLELLDECVSSLPVAADFLVAVDGRYSMFPGAGVCSPKKQAEAIKNAASRVGLLVEVVSPGRPWASEMEKRTRMFQVGNKYARPVHDWFLVIDADEKVAWKHPHLKRGLEGAEESVAMFMLQGWNGLDKNRVRGLFRAHPSLRVEGAHYRYLCGDRVLWGHPEVDQQEPAFDATGLLGILHQRHRRPQARQEAISRYCEARDKAGVEAVSWSHAL